MQPTKMWRCLVCVCLICGVKCQSSYVVLLPQHIRPGMTLNIGVNILRSDGDVILIASFPASERQPHVRAGTVSFSGVAVSTTISQASVLNRRAANTTLQLKLPLNLSSRVFQYVIHVEGRGGLHFTETLRFRLHAKSVSVFIQTDKGIYKAGQTVQRVTSWVFPVLGFSQKQVRACQPNTMRYYTIEIHLRTFAVFPDLKPLIGEFDVKIFDPQKNEIKQWLKVRDDSNMIARDFTLSDEPMLGKWKISSEANGQSVERFFSVEEFVLPKFEVTISLPSFGLTSDQELSGTVEAKYTFGKSVEGIVNLRIKNNAPLSPFYRCTEPIVELLPFKLNGKTPFKVPMSRLVHLVSCERRRVGGREIKLQNRQIIRIEANITEALTGNRRDGFKTMTYFDKKFKLEWLPTNSKNFKPGLWYNAFLKVSTQDGRPLPIADRRRKLVTIKLWTTFADCQYRNNIPTIVRRRRPIAPYPDIQTGVPRDGIINWINVIPPDVDWLTLTAKFPGADSASIAARRMHSTSNIYIQVNLYTGDLKVGDVAAFDIICTLPMDNFVYQVFTEIRSNSSFIIEGVCYRYGEGEVIDYRMHIVHSQNIGVDPIPFFCVEIFSRGNMVSMVEVEAHNRTEVFVDVEMTTQMAPNAVFVVYKVQPNGEMLADVVSFTVQGIFENDVSIEVDRVSVEPGEDVNIVVNADPNSTVNLLAVDQSVLLLKSGNDITPGAVERAIYTFEERPVFKRNPQLMSVRYPLAYDGIDSNHILQNAGVIVRTDGFIRRAIRCRPVAYTTTWPPRTFGPITGTRQFTIPTITTTTTTTTTPPPFEPEPPEEESKRVRELFPDTWLWTNKTVGADGRAKFTATVPDTITSWITSAFAMNTVSGLGVSHSTAKLEVFMPFFVSLDLPFSVVRGEELVLQAIVFNFLDVDTEVDVTLARSDNFNNIVVGIHSFLTTSADQHQTIQVNAGKAKSVFFPIVPTQIGNIDISVRARAPVAGDALIRQLLVVAEGVPQEYTLSFLIDLTKTNQYNNMAELPFPGDLVDGTKRVHINALGDIMAPTINNLDKLLKLPSGCGEQNMLKFAPDVFILKYLSSKNQLTDAIRTKAINFLETGYQKELTFQHNDGSFSAFGERDKSGSMWLSAFVLVSFIKAKPFIFVDEKVLTRTTSWIISKQSEDGSFPEPGRVLHAELQGGSGFGTALTAYVLVALLQKENTSDSQQISVQAAISRAQTYLETNLEMISDTYSLAISTYALTLARSASAASALDRLDRRAIVQGELKHWEVPDPPSNRGYWKPPNRAKARSIELTAYVLLIHSHDNNVIQTLPIAKWLTGQRNANGGFVSTQDTVLALEALSELPSLDSAPVLDVNIVVSAPAFSHSFAVSKTNALFLQTVDLEPIPSALTIEASGTGIALLQISVLYNVHNDSQQPSFDIRSEITNETVNDFILETCAQYLKSDMSGMVVQETGIPAGFEADVESIKKFKALKRIETLDRKVVLYFDAVTSDPLCITMKVVRSGLVAKSRPVPIQIYLYYSPEDQVTVFYQSDLLAKSSFCDICADCKCPGPDERRKE